MYSILIKTGDNMYQYLLGDDDAYWTGTKDEAQVKIGTLLKQYTINKLAVVHNTMLTSAITIADVTE